MGTSTSERFILGSLAHTVAPGKHVLETDPTIIRGTLSNRLLHLRYDWSSDTSEIIHSISENNHFKARNSWFQLITFSCDILLKQSDVINIDADKIRNIQDELAEKSEDAISKGLPIEERIRIGDEALDQLICIMGIDVSKLQN